MLGFAVSDACTVFVKWLLSKSNQFLPRRLGDRRSKI
jgi:hypothetical protein